MPISDTLGQAALGAIRTAVNGGSLFLFSGTVPADADDALNMATTHTQLVAFPGVSFDAPSGPGMTKALAETWDEVIAFDGAQSAEATLAPTFWRFCATGDNGRGAATTPRLQGTAGGPFTSLPCAALTDNGTNTLTISTFAVLMEAV